MATEGKTLASDLEAALGRARAAYDKGEMHGTLAELTPHVGWSSERSGTRAQALLFMSNAWLRLGSAGEAANCAEDALLALPDDPRYAAFGAALHGARGRALQQMGLADLARVHFEQELLLVERAVALGDPAAAARVGCHLDLARSLLSRSSYRELEIEVERWLADPLDPIRGAGRLYSDPRFARQQDALHLYLGVAQHHVELTDPVRERRAERTLEALRLSGTATNEGYQAGQWLTCLRLRAGHIREADATFSALVADPQAGRNSVSPDERLFQSALEGWIALDAPELRDRERARVGLRAAWRARVESFAQLAPREGGLALLQYGRAEMALTLLARLDAAIDGPSSAAVSLFDELVRAAMVGSLPRVLGASTVDLAGARRALHGRADGLLLFTFGPDAGAVVLVDADSAELEFLPGRRVLGPAAVELAMQAATSPRGLSEQARKRRQSRIEAARCVLEDGLIQGAVARALGRWRSVVVAGLETLDSVPFELLHLPSGEAIGLEREVTRTPSIPVFAALVARDTHATSARKHVVVAGAEVEEGLLGNPLACLTESGRAQFAVRGAHTALLGGRDATLSGLRAELAGGATALAFVTHGVFDHRRERQAGLLLSADSACGRVLWGDEVERLPLPALVLLGACGSGLEARRRGDAGAAGLEGACFAAGARAVVLADSTLSLGPTIDFLSQALECVAEGASSAEAVRRARRAVHDSPTGSDPYYWGHIRLSGEPGRPARVEEGWSWRAWVLLGALALAAATYGLRAARLRSRA